MPVEKKHKTMAEIFEVEGGGGGGGSVANSTIHKVQQQRILEAQAKIEEASLERILAEEKARLKAVAGTPDANMMGQPGAGAQHNVGASLIQSLIAQKHCTYLKTKPLIP